MMKAVTYIFIISGALFFLQGCGNSNSDTPAQKSSAQFTLLPSANTGIDFENLIIEKPKRNLGNYDYFYTGSGVATGDFNNDGLPDVYFCGNDTDNKLYINKGNWKFEDVTQKAGVSSAGKWSTGVTLVDLNKDGWLDIYVCNSGPYNRDTKLANQLYINNKNGTFTEEAEKYGIADISRSTQASFFDMDNDGDLDLFVMNHSLRNREGDASQWHRTFASLDPVIQKKEVNTLFRNEGNGTFTDITAQAKVNKVGFGLGIAISDYDKNGFLDIYIANDYFIPDFMYMNNGDGTFTDKIKQKTSHVSYYAMGCDAADINNDGHVDLAIVDMTPADHFRNKTLMASMNVQQFTWLEDVMKFAPQYMFNSLQINRGFGVFSEVGLLAGVSQTDWSWSSILADFDNDGYKDLLVTNGYWKDTKDNDWRIQLSQEYAQKGKSQEVYFEHLQTAASVPIPNYIYQNNGDLTFTDQSKNWNFDSPSFSHGASYADLDQDGDLDLVINNLGSKAFVYQNNSRENGSGNFIRFKLETGASNCMSPSIKIYYEGGMQVVENHFTRGYQSYMEPVAHFGLGAVDKIEKAIIECTNGSTFEIAGPAINKTHLIKMEELQMQAKAKEKPNPPFMDITGQQQLMTFIHKENVYNDFGLEVLLPHQQSKLGPALAVGDINGDGLDDFYIGGAKGQQGEIYVQLPSMIFEPLAQTVFAGDAEKEDVGAHFFDADNDGDIDLYVASGGGGAFREGSDLLQDRLYLNDGKGRFTKGGNALPAMLSSTAAVASADWDKDGDLDLIVGGRTNPGKYPQPPQSFLLRNDGGKFVDVTEEQLPELSRIGMVTDALWVDIDQNGWTDLMLVGEWMPITLFKNENGKLVNLGDANALSNQKGWWYQVASGDFDKDGDLDFIVGNIGKNNKFHPSDEKNLHVFSNDFDDNQMLDIVLSKHYKGSIVPVRGKECSTEQMPFLAEKFTSYSSFASSNMEDIYGKEKLEEALHYQVNNFASLYLENQGNFQFAIKELPVEAQIAPINSIVVYDFDRDGQLDVVIGGNMFETEVETPAYDAGKGLYMKGLGQGEFETSLHMPESGLFMHKNVKGIAPLMLGNDKRPCLIVANNDSKPQMYVWRK